MSALLSKLLGSKVFSIVLIGLLIALIIFVGVLHLQKKNLDKKVDSLNKTIDTKDGVIVELNQQIKVKDLEIQYLQKGISITSKYEQEKEKVLENETTVKEQILETILSSEESKDWWNTPIPDDVLNLITCH